MITEEESDVLHSVYDCYETDVRSGLYRLAKHPNVSFTYEELVKMLVDVLTKKEK